MTTAAAEPKRRAAKRPAKPSAKSDATTRTVRRPSPKLEMVIHTEASERFRALSPEERRRRLDAFRQTFAPAFASVDEYLAEKRREDRDA